MKVFRFDPEKDREPYYRTMRWRRNLRTGSSIVSTASDGSRTPPSPSACPAATASAVPTDEDQRDMRPPLPETRQEYRSRGPHRAPSGFPGDQGSGGRPGPFLRKIPLHQTLSDHPNAAAGRRTQAIPEDEALLEDAVRCILCACCTASCPVNQDAETADYVGPAALVRAFRYLFDSRDEGAQERIALLDARQGAWGCRTLWKCTEVCPREIPVTKQIGRIKARIFEARKQDKEK